MNSPDPQPKLPAWIFVVTDLALIGAAALIATTSPQPLPASSVLWIVACVGLGAIVGLVPLVLIYEQRKNEQLDERQRALEALSRTVSSSAEQISIAANGLHQIAELALKNLRMAEHLPHKLQEKIAEFQAQLAATTDADREELERELLSLRTSESERLESVSQRIAKTTAEWTKLEAAAQQHLAAANEASTRIAAGLTGAIGKAQSAAEQALAQARIDAARDVGETGGQAVRALAAAKAAALAEFDAKIASAAALVAERLTAELSARIAALPPPVPASPAMPAASIAEPEARPTDRPPITEPPAEPAPAGTSAPPAPSAPSPSDSAAPVADATPAPPAPAVVTPRKPRRPRREEAPPSAVAETNETPKPAAVPVAEEPAPVPAAAIPEITPVAPTTAEPFSGHIAIEPPPPPAPAVEPIAATPAPAEPARRAGRRPERTDDTESEPGLGLDLAESSSGSVAEGVLTSDGATRLLVTAYIGIGNRLFIRGEGPGLSWDKGVPLQFVSIGKWRWETNDATSPVRFKLYKNDAVECAALGQQAVEPGHQQEVTAAF
jgi:hypothetical protein